MKPICKPMDIASRLNSHIQQLKQRDSFVCAGKLVRIIGLTLEAVGFSAAIGSKCRVYQNGHDFIEAEVIGFANQSIFLMSSENMQGITPGAKVLPMDDVVKVGVGEELLGRVIDGAGEPLDGMGAITTTQVYPLHGQTINPLQRATIREPLDVGVRAINGLFTIGRGQRMGLFAGSGVGKSVLLGMMTRFTAADIIVVGLIGERGREVKEFIEESLGAEGLQRSVIVAAPADTSPLMRLHGAMRATAIAEYFRDSGLNVLLLMDSITRFAQAQRQIGLSIGEPPATKGYPPSVFSKLSELVERAGNADVGGGSITAFYTVLAEGDDQQDPIADATRSLIDGHLVLSRDLADAGHYPAIDIEASISRVLTAISSAEQQAIMAQFKRYYSLYQHNKDLITIGAYQPGSNPELDRALELLPVMKQFLCQGINESVDYQNSHMQLQTLLK